MSILSNWLSKATPSFFSSSTPSPSNTVKLRMELVEPKDWEAVARKAMKWSWKACQKANEQPPKSQAFAQLKDCGFICEALTSHIKNTYFANRGSSENIDKGRVGPKELYVCKDEKNRIHGITTVEKNRTSLIGSLLVTHPRNIPDHKRIRDPRGVKGVGSAADDHINRIAPQRNIKAILLVNSDSSAPFYRKRGYTKINHPDYTFFKAVNPKSAL